MSANESEAEEDPRVYVREAPTSVRPGQPSDQDTFTPEETLQIRSFAGASTVRVNGQVVDRPGGAGLDDERNTLTLDDGVVDEPGTYEVVVDDADGGTTTTTIDVEDPSDLSREQRTINQGGQQNISAGRQSAAATDDDVVAASSDEVLEQQGVGAEELSGPNGEPSRIVGPNAPGNSTADAVRLANTPPETITRPRRRRTFDETPNEPGVQTGGVDGRKARIEGAGAGVNPTDDPRAVVLDRAGDEGRRAFPARDDPVAPDTPARAAEIGEVGTSDVVLNATGQTDQVGGLRTVFADGARAPDPDPRRTPTAGGEPAARADRRSADPTEDASTSDGSSASGDVITFRFANQRLRRAAAGRTSDESAGRRRGGGSTGSVPSLALAAPLTVAEGVTQSQSVVDELVSDVQSGRAPRLDEPAVDIGQQDRWAVERTVLGPATAGSALVDVRDGATDDLADDIREGRAPRLDDPAVQADQTVRETTTSAPAAAASTGDRVRGAAASTGDRVVDVRGDAADELLDDIREGRAPRLDDPAVQADQTVRDVTGGAGDVAERGTDEATDVGDDLATDIREGRAPRLDDPAVSAPDAVRDTTTDAPGTAADVASGAVDEVADVRPAGLNDVATDIREGRAPRADQPVVGADATVRAATTRTGQRAAGAGRTTLRTARDDPEAVLAAGAPLAAAEPTPVGEVGLAALLVGGAALGAASTGLPDSREELTAPGTTSEIDAPTRPGRRRSELDIPEESTVATSELAVGDDARQSELGAPESTDPGQSELDTPTRRDEPLAIRTAALVGQQEARERQRERTDVSRRRERRDSSIPERFLPDDEVVIGEEVDQPSVEDQGRRFVGVDRPAQGVRTFGEPEPVAESEPARATEPAEPTDTAVGPQVGAGPIPGVSRERPQRDRGALGPGRTVGVTPQTVTGQPVGLQTAAVQAPGVAQLGLFGQQTVQQPAAVEEVVLEQQVEDVGVGAPRDPPGRGRRPRREDDETALDVTRVGLGPSGSDPDERGRDLGPNPVGELVAALGGVGVDGRRAPAERSPSADDLAVGSVPVSANVADDPGFEAAASFLGFGDDAAETGDGGGLLDFGGEGR